MKTPEEVVAEIYFRHGLTDDSCNDIKIAIVAAIRKARAESLEEAAKVVEGYGPQPCNPNGRRAELAKRIRDLIAKERA